MSEDWDCVVVGGGVAGLSAAIVLGRVRRRVLLLDIDGQSNRAAAHVGGGLGFDGTPPEELYGEGKRRLASYESVTVRDDEAVAAREEEGGAFSLGLRDEADRVRARTLILATGMDYQVPDVPGFADHWGGAVFHCPFCHGWEVRDRRLVVYAGAEMAERLTSLAHGWSDDVSTVDPEEVAELRTEGGTVQAVALRDGSEVPCDAVLVHAPLRRRGELPENLGLELTEQGLVSIDAHGQTSMPGVYAVGDLAVAPQQVPIAAGSGHMAGLAVVRDLLLGSSA